MHLLKTLLVTVTCAALAACDGDKVPMANTTADATAKRFDAPIPGKAALYIYRPDSAGSVLDINANQRVLGPLRKGTYLRIDVAPGSLDVRCRSNVALESAISQPVVLTAATITFVQARYTLSGWPAGAYCDLQTVDPSHARQEIIKLQRIQEVGGSSD